MMWKPDVAAPVRALVRWHLTSQYGARRNAAHVAVPIDRAVDVAERIIDGE
jgi:hypothetical protein